MTQPGRTDPWPTRGASQPPLTPSAGPPLLGGEPEPTRPAVAAGTSRPGRTAAVVAAAVALVVVAIVAVAVVRSGDGAEQGEATAPTATTTPPTYAELTPATLGDTLERLSRFVEGERTLEFRNPVTVEIVDPEELQARNAARLAPLADAVGIMSRQLAALGLTTPDTDLLAGMSALANQQPAYYDPATGTLSVAAGPLDPALERTLVHELTVALDDQWFDLTRPGFVPFADDPAFGRSAAVEGNATRVDQAWVESLDDATRREVYRIDAGRSASGSSDAIPWVLSELARSARIDGVAVIDTALNIGGEQAVDDLLTTPPTTSSEVLWPERWVAQPEVAVVEVPPTDAATDVVFATGSLGEVSLRLGLWEAVGGAEAAGAARGWRGDRLVAWRNAEGNDCVRVDVATSSVEARDRLMAAMERWAEVLPDAAAEPIELDSVRFTSCTTPTDAAGVESPL